MNEEQAVLDFFALPENLPLGLSVAELVDTQRQSINNRYWLELKQHLTSSYSSSGENAWTIDITEDGNSSETLIGLNFKCEGKQDIYLHPMMEQQYLGNIWRIYTGLMWSDTPTPEHLKIQAVEELKVSLLKAGYKNNARFLAWQWTSLHPRRRDFLLRYSREPDVLLTEAETTLKPFLTDYRDLIGLSNTALQSVVRSKAISLDRLRGKAMG